MAGEELLLTAWLPSQAPEGVSDDLVYNVRNWGRTRALELCEMGSLATPIVTRHQLVGVLITQHKRLVHASARQDIGEVRQSAYLDARGVGVRRRRMRFVNIHRRVVGQEVSYDMIRVG